MSLINGYISTTHNVANYSLTSIVLRKYAKIEKIKFLSWRFKRTYIETEVCSNDKDRMISGMEVVRKYFATLKPEDGFSVSKMSIIDYLLFRYNTYLSRLKLPYSHSFLVDFDHT